MSHACTQLQGHLCREFSVRNPQVHKGAPVSPLDGSWEWPREGLTEGCLGGCRRTVCSPQGALRSMTAQDSCFVHNLLTLPSTCLGVRNEAGPGFTSAFSSFASSFVTGGIWKRGPSPALIPQLFHAISLSGQGP